MIIENPAYVFYRRIKRIRFDPGQSLSAAQAIARGLRIGVFAGRRLRSRRGVSSRPAGGRSGRFPFAEAYPEPLGGKDILITADTVVIADGRILGKPAGRETALDMLRSLSGRSHSVITGVTLRNGSRSRTFDSRTKVFFKQLSDEEIDYYVDRYRPYDKAGAYGIQEWIGYVAIEQIEGSFYNVMGLPVQKLLTELEIFIELKEK